MTLKEDQALIGRSKELEELIKLIQKRRDILLIGHIGSGKTAILKHVYDKFNGDGKHRVLYIEQSSPLKDTLYRIAYQIWEKYRELKTWEEEEAKEPILEWKQIKRKINRMNNRDLAGIIFKSIQNRDYIIILDHLERVTPTSKAVFEVLLGKCCLVGSYSGYPKDAGSNLRKLWWRFKTIEIKNLSKEETLQLIDYYFEKYNILAEDPNMFRKAIWKISKGNPMAVKDICYEGSIEKYMSKKQVRGLDHKAGSEYFDMSPVLILFCVFFVVLRFFALGTDDMDTYVFAGGMGALGLFVRFLMFKYMK